MTNQTIEERQRNAKDANGSTLLPWMQTLADAASELGATVERTDVDGIVVCLHGKRLSIGCDGGDTYEFGFHRFSLDVGDDIQVAEDYLLGWLFGVDHCKG